MFQPPKEKAEWNLAELPSHLRWGRISLIFTVNICDETKTKGRHVSGLSHMTNACNRSLLNTADSSSLPMTVWNRWLHWFSITSKVLTISWKSSSCNKQEKREMWNSQNEGKRLILQTNDMSKWHFLERWEALSSGRRSQRSWPGHLVRMPVGHLPGEVCWARPSSSRRSPERPSTC